ncbi:MAG: type II toxin-antitoxin system VapC family toxin [Thermoanaerobaculia bacterium]
MKLYAETSAVVAWWMGEARAADVKRALDSAEAVLASELTVIECERVLVRGLALGSLTDVDASGRRATLQRLIFGWTLLRMDNEILERAKRAFPDEPLRTLDALHLSSALMVRSSLPDLVFLSLDERLRRNAKQLGFGLLPAPRRGFKS